MFIPYPKPVIGERHSHSFVTAEKPTSPVTLRFLFKDFIYKVHLLALTLGFNKGQSTLVWVWHLLQSGLPTPWTIVIWSFISTCLALTVV